MTGFTAAEAVARMEEAIGRPVDVAIVNTARPAPASWRAYAKSTRPPLEAGDVPSGCEVVGGEFWCGEIARHDRRRLSFAIRSVLSRRLLGN